jgi:serine/threonine-protein kinase
MTNVVSGLAVGDSIGGYRIDRMVGEGGMGVVYVATHSRLGRRAALKVMIPRLTQDPDFRERFIRESRIAASIEHTNIIPIYDADEENGILYLAMRYVDGVDLAEMLGQKGRLSLGEALALVGPVAAALDAAHEAGLVHRDVKPANVLIESSTHHVFLTDFGLAKSAAASGFTRTGSFIGTPHYCSPEQINGNRIDGRSDIYSLGCLAFHCLAGQPPFPRDSEVAVIHAHLTASPPAVTTVRPDLPAFLDGVIATAMAKFPDVRYSSGVELVEALRAGSLHPSPPITVPVPAPTIAESSGPPDRSRSGDQTIRSGRKRRRWVIAASIAAMLIAGIAAAAVLVNTGSGTAEKRSSAKALPPAPRVGQLIAQRLRTQVNPRQARLTNDVRTLRPTQESLLEMEAAARQVRESVLESQGWAGTLDAHTKADAAAKQLLAKALSAHAAYAEAVETLPTSPARITRNLADRVINLANHAEEAYARLSGATEDLPEVPLHRADHLHLFEVAVKPRAAPPSTVTITTTRPSSPVTGAGSPASTPLRRFAGTRYSIDYPSAWNVEAAEERKASYFDTTIRDPTDPKRLIRVDSSPHASPDLEADARPVVSALERAPGYQQLAYDRITFAGHPALRWEFLVREEGRLLHKVDIFLLDNAGNGFGILTEAPADQWSSWQPLFQRVLDSLALSSG